MPTPMTWESFTEAREQISEKIGLPKKMNLTTFEKFLGITTNTSTNWKRRGEIPSYIESSVEAHLMASKTALKKMYESRIEST